MIIGIVAVDSKFGIGKINKETGKCQLLFKLKKDMFLMIFQYSSVFKKATTILKANQMKCVNLKVLSLKDFYPKKDEFRFKNWQEQYCNSADSLATFSVSINSVAQFLCDQLEDLFLKKHPK